jgi:hypothetical protein
MMADSISAVLCGLAQNGDTAQWRDGKAIFRAPSEPPADVIDLIDGRKCEISVFLHPDAVQRRLEAEADLLQAPRPPDIGDDHWQIARRCTMWQRSANCSSFASHQRSSALTMPIGADCWDCVAQAYSQPLVGGCWHVPVAQMLTRQALLAEESALALKRGAWPPSCARSTKQCRLNGRLSCSRCIPSCASGR